MLGLLASNLRPTAPAAPGRPGPQQFGAAARLVFETLVISRIEI